MNYALRMFLTVLIDTFLTFVVVYSICFWALGSENLEGRVRLWSAMAVSFVGSVTLGLINGLILGFIPPKWIDQFCKVLLLCILASFFSVLWLAIAMIMSKEYSFSLIGAVFAFFITVCTCANAVTLFIIRRLLPISKSD